MRESKRKVLGRGLGALISDVIEEEKRGLKEINVDKIIPSPGQPRSDMDDLSGLSQSIKSRGVIQPVIVVREGESYQLVAGERRWRAAKLAGLERIPAIEIKAEENERLEIALIENIQRSDLNSIDEAKAYRILLERFNLTQEKLSKRVGKDRATIANTIRLLNLPESIRGDVSHETISAGHARVILRLKNIDEQLRLRDRIIKEELSVRQTESLVESGKSKKRKKVERKRDSELNELKERLIEHFKTKIEIRGTKNRGLIGIRYFSSAELERLAEILLK